MSDTNKRIMMESHPFGFPSCSDFKFEDVPIPEPSDGEFVGKQLVTLT